MKKNIPIDPSGNAPDADLYRATNDEACWTNDGTKDRTVVFTGPNGSPFAKDEYLIPAGQTVCSGPITTTAPNPTDFHYDIRAARAASETAADPNLIVH